MLILIWNTVAGLDAVPADAREAAIAWATHRRPRWSGSTYPWPCPTSSPGSGWPPSTVIGLVTVTALIGLGGLGQQITYGFNIAYNTPIIVGLVFSVALAAVSDLLLVGAQRLAVPWSRHRAGTGPRGELRCISSSPGLRLVHDVGQLERLDTASPSSSGTSPKLSAGGGGGRARARGWTRASFSGTPAGAAGGGQRRQRVPGRSHAWPS